jgi:hypothetical protein
VGFALAIDWTGAAVPWLRPQVTIAGIVLILLGVALRWWAILTLGRYFTLDVAMRSTQAVVQSGSYPLVLHPASSGTLLTLLGTGLALAKWAGVVALLAGAPSAYSTASGWKSGCSLKRWASRMWTTCAAPSASSPSSSDRNSPPQAMGL